MKTAKQIIIALFLAFFVGVGDTFAQLVNIPRAQRIPQLSTEQRDSLFSGLSYHERTGGLIIFNTDNNCLEYWNQIEEAWSSLCGAVRPKMKIPAEYCHRIRVHGQYFKDAPLDFTHYIVLPAMVVEPGSYTISARTGNGYFFHTSGVFEETGIFELILAGMGTPREIQTDELVFTINGIEIETPCKPTIEIGELNMGCRVDRGAIRLNGTYFTRQMMDEEEHFLVVPVDVIVPGYATMRTAEINGIRFRGSKELTTTGADEIILYAEGIPVQEGAFIFTFTSDGGIITTCQFSLQIFSELGTHNDPACNCADIARERPFAADGEYWIWDCAFDDGSEDLVLPKYRVFCDISGGGWMLVWSYSEWTARNVYVQHSTSATSTGNQNMMRVGRDFYGTSINRPLNTIQTHVPGDDNPEMLRIDYYNFRMPLAIWQSVFSVGARQIRIRIADNPTNVRDMWAANNYVIMTPQSNDRNPIFATWSNSNTLANRVPSVGRVFGQNFSISARAGGTGGGWFQNGGNMQINMRHPSSLNSHIFMGSLSSGSSTFLVRPDLNGGVDNTQTNGSMNQMFGSFDGTQPNHHFGRCGRNGDNFSFSTRTCSGSGTNDAGLFPHTHLNNPVQGRPGEMHGRVLQWWVR